MLPLSKYIKQVVGQKAAASIDAENFMADKACDADEIVKAVIQANARPIIPSRKKIKNQKERDGGLYKLRHIIENILQKFKEWRGIATRYAKNTKSYVAALCLRSLLMWVKIS